MHPLLGNERSDAGNTHQNSIGRQLFESPIGRHSGNIQLADQLVLGRYPLTRLQAGAQLALRKHAGIELMVAPVCIVASAGAPVCAGSAALENAADVAPRQAVGCNLYGVAAASVPGSCPNGKNVCSLHTPSSVPCGVSRSSASSTNS